MGTIVNGINGGVSGKTGSVIGSSWKSINYLKGLYKKSNKPATEEQLINQAKFKLVMRFLLPITSYLQIGFGQKKADRQTPVNAAFSSTCPWSFRELIQISYLIIARYGFRTGRSTWRQHKHRFMPTRSSP